MFSTQRRIPKIGSAILVLGACSSDSAGDETVVTSEIGAEGGSLSTSDGASIAVPAGALAADVQLSAGRIAASSVADLPAEAQSLGALHAFTPHGQVFAQPVTLSLPYSGNANAVLRLSDESDTTWEVVSGATFSGGVATVQVTTLSVFAVVEQTAPALEELTSAYCEAASSCDPTQFAYDYASVAECTSTLVTYFDSVAAEYEVAYGPACAQAFLDYYHCVFSELEPGCNEYMNPVIGAAADDCAPAFAEACPEGYAEW